MAKRNLGNPVVAAAVASKVKEKADGIKTIIVKNRKPILYAAGGLTAYLVVRKIAKNAAKIKALKSPEAPNAQTIYELIKDKLPRSLWAQLNPINFTIDTIFPVKWAKEVLNIKSSTVYDGLLEIHPRDIEELKKTYKGIFDRNLEKDLQDNNVLGKGELYDKVMASWRRTDINNTGYKHEADKSITVQEGNKRENYKPGVSADYSNCYVVTKKVTKGYRLVKIEGVLKQLPLEISANTYVGTTTGFKIGNKEFKGGITFTSSSGKKGIHVVFKNDDGSFLFTALSVADLIFYKKYDDFAADFKKNKTKKLRV